MYWALIQESHIFAAIFQLRLQDTRVQKRYLWQKQKLEIIHFEFEITAL